MSSTLPRKIENVSILSRFATKVVRKSYKTQKAQDLVGLVLFFVAISCVLCAWRNI